VRIGNLYGPDATFLGVPAADPDVVSEWSRSGAVIIGAPFDGGTSHRAGCRFGPQAIRVTDYLAHDGMRPSLALGVDPLKELSVVDLGDVEMTGVARHVGWGKVSVIHFDAHADTGDSQMGSLYGHGTPMRRLIESGACRGDRFLQIGLRGYWPEPATLDWMAEQGMRSFEMSEIVSRGLDEVVGEAIVIAMSDCDAVFLSIDVDVVDPGAAPGTGTPEPGGLTSRQLLDAVRRIAMETPIGGVDVVEVSPPYDHAEITAYLGNRIVLEALGGIAWRRKSQRGEATRTPSDPLLEGR